MEDEEAVKLAVAALVFGFMHAATELAGTTVEFRASAAFDAASVFLAEAKRRAEPAT